MSTATLAALKTLADFEAGPVMTETKDNRISQKLGQSLWGNKDSDTCCTEKLALLGPILL